MAPRPPQRHGARPSPRRRLLRGAAVAAASAVVIAGAGSYVAYSQLDDDISVLDAGAALGADRPAAFTPPASAPDASDPGAGTSSIVPPPAPADDRTGAVEAAAPLDILLIGSDTRQGAADSDVEGETPGLSDTTIVLHLSADRSRAHAVSIPRDSMVHRPTCLTQDGQVTDPGGLSMFNAAYAVGGPVCTQRTVEQLTGIRIDHFAVIDFSGCRDKVDALGGVPMCVGGRWTTRCPASTWRPGPTRSAGSRPWTTCGSGTRSATTVTSGGCAASRPSSPPWCARRSRATC